MLGVRSRKALEEFSLSRRLKARLGALLTRKVEVSPTVLEAAAPGSSLEKILLSPLTLKDNLDADALEEAGADLEEEGLLPTLVAKSDGWSLIALKDEVLAEEGWAEAEESVEEGAGRGLGDGGGGADRPLARSHRVSPTAAAAGDVFSEERLQALKVTLLTSADAEARVEALRLVGYSPLTSDEKTELFFQALNDQEAMVRSTAAALLREVGLDVGTSEVLRALASSDEDERLFAVERLGRAALTGKGLAAAAAVVALVAELRIEASASVRKKVLSALEEAAAFIAASPDRARELVSLLLAHLGPQFDELAYPVRRLVARVGEFLSGETSEVLWSEVESTPDRRVKVMLLTLLAELAGVDIERVSQAMAGEIALPEERDVDFRSFSSYLHQMAQASVDALVDAYPAAAAGQKKHIVRLLDDICRYEEVSLEAKERVAGLFRKYLAGAGRDLRIIIMSTTLPRDEALSEETRRALAALFLDNIHDVHMPTDIDNIEYTISRMGFPAVEPLVERLDERFPERERLRAARLLGELGRLEGLKAANSRNVAKALEEVLRALEARLIEGFPEPGEIFIAQGKICSSGAVKRAAVDVMARSLEEHLEGDRQDARVYEAAGWTAASPKAPEKFVALAMSRFFEVLERPEEEIPADTRLEAGMKIYELGSEARFYTDLLPAVLKGLMLVYLGQERRTARRKTIVGFLLRKWQEVTTGQRLWGPGNVTELVRVLAEIGTDPSTESGTKISIAKALGRRLYQIPVMFALAEILETDDSPGEMARLASAFLVALLKRRDEEGRFEEDERAEVLEALGRVTLRRHLETRIRGTEKVRETVVDALSNGLKDQVPGCQDLLVRIRDSDNVPKGLREKVAETLQIYQSIVPYHA